MFKSIILTLALMASVAHASTAIQLPEQVDENWTMGVLISSIVAMQSDGIVDLHFSSPGGYVSDAVQTMGLMEQGQRAGLKYRCYVEGMAMSAAFMVLTACDERYATRDSRFLHHEMWFQLNPSQLYPSIQPGLMDEMQKSVELQTRINNYVADKMRISWDKLKPYYLMEQILTAIELVNLSPGFITVGVK
jgi:ATP-dependent protease ClpP protease subunit